MKKHFITGLHKILIYLRIIIHVPVHYLLHSEYFSSPVDYVRFLRRAFLLLMAFRHNKIVKVIKGYKLHLYLPAYPSRAFFYAIENKLLKTPPAPTSVVFSMTKACKYKCRHCYQHNDKGKDLDDEMLVKTALEVRDTGVSMFDIEGGEPFLRFDRLLKLVRALDDRSEIWVNSTGAGIENGMLETLVEAGLFGMMVSIHSPDAEIHDRFTGIPGSFQRAYDALKTCRGKGITAAFNTVLSEEEVKSGGIARIMELARDIDCDYVQLIHPKPAGTWLGRRDGMQTSESIKEAVCRKHMEYNSSKKQYYPSLAAQVFEESGNIFGCTAGAVDRFYIGAGGEVQPCEFLNISFGNVKEEPFKVIYKRMRSFFHKPCRDWLCCTQAESINDIFIKRNSIQTPLEWKETKNLVNSWHRGKPTPLYEKLGIYK